MTAFVGAEESSKGVTGRKKKRKGKKTRKET